ncbi:MAG: dTDP-4-dehydrorhamnose reductase [Anaerolineae bacterium]|jgi:dTDP-4-dehydrorhamnose reductase
MRVFITGCDGQLGRALSGELAGDAVAGCDLPGVDIVDRVAIRAAISDFRPDVVIHTAAWTDVDGCARDPGRAYRVNGIGTQNVALACAACGAAMVYVSTNEVFDGASTTPYREWDPVHPINPYARSKVAGEWFTRNLLNRFYIARTAWLYAPGGRNFSNPDRIIELAREHGALKVVDDEVGNPTFALDLARAILALIETEAYGVYHLVNAGYCSRFELVRHVLRLVGLADVAVEPISLADFERPSSPPSFAPLLNTAAAAHGVTLRPWQEAVAAYLGV